MTQKIEQSQRQERVAAWNRRAECDLAAFQNSPKQTYQAEKARDRKLCANLEEAIRRSGLQDGMTVSFHHIFILIVSKTNLEIIGSEFILIDLS